ncbi:MAG TPA: trypsin-like peptidase domain-containing protein [Solimonas sp.]|nr:trypsin-like peptidase domain-containing protein [Solimonas sp.]
MINHKFSSSLRGVFTALALSPALALAAPAGLAAKTSAPRLVLPAPDLQPFLRAEKAATRPQPLRFAAPIGTVITPLSQGRWETLADGRALWRLSVQSAGASSLNFAFTKLALPAGAQLYIYDSAGKRVRGPYTGKDVVQGQLWTPVVEGDEAVVEVSLPQAARPALVLELGKVNYGFREFWKAGDAAKSGSCNIDVACAEGDAWRNEIRSVARYTIAGALLCTGQLVNNTANDFKPLFLTANHCVTLPPEAITTVYYWNYQTSSCGGAPDGNLDDTQIGALMLAANPGTETPGPDFTLMQLVQAPDAAFHVFYSGWDNRDVAPVGVTGIHHPNGDEKRISIDFDPTEIAAYLEPGGSAASIANPTHIRVVRWDRGVTEGGSSGSGIWNNEHRLVGQLSGGYSSCDAPDDSDWYGRLNQDWFALDTPLTSVASYLDPGGAGSGVLDGADPNGLATPPPPPSGTTPPPGGTTTPPASVTTSGGGGGALSLPALLGLLLIRRRRAGPGPR